MSGNIRRAPTIHIFDFDALGVRKGRKFGYYAVRDHLVRPLQCRYTIDRRTVPDRALIEPDCAVLIMSMALGILDLVKLSRWAGAKDFPNVT